MRTRVCNFVIIWPYSACSESYLRDPGRRRDYHESFLASLKGTWAIGGWYRKILRTLDRANGKGDELKLKC